MIQTIPAAVETKIKKYNAEYLNVVSNSAGIIFRNVLVTSLLEAHSHVFLLDSFLYGDIKLFYPLKFNLFLKIISSLSVYSFWRTSFLLGLAVYVYRVVNARKSADFLTIHKSL